MDKTVWLNPETGGVYNEKDFYELLKVTHNKPTYKHPMIMITIEDAGFQIIEEWKVIKSNGEYAFLIFARDAEMEKQSKYFDIHKTREEYATFHGCEFKYLLNVRMCPKEGEKFLNGETVKDYIYPVE